MHMLNWAGEAPLFTNDARSLAQRSSAASKGPAIATRARLRTRSSGSADWNFGTAWKVARSASISSATKNKRKNEHKTKQQPVFRKHTRLITHPDNDC